MRTAKPLPPCLRSLLALVGLRRLPLRLLLRRYRQLRKLPSAHPLHQLFHLLAALEETVHLFDGRARPACDALPPRPVDQLRQRTLRGTHRQDDRLDARELLLVDLVDALELLAQPRDQLHEPADRAHAADHPVALEEVLEAELPLSHS